MADARQEKAARRLVDDLPDVTFVEGRRTRPSHGRDQDDRIDLAQEWSVIEPILDRCEAPDGTRRVVALGAGAMSLTLAKGRYLYFYCLGQRGTARTGCRQPYVLAGDAEALVEDLYRQIQLPRAWVRRLTEELEGGDRRASGRGIGAQSPSDEDARQARGGAGQAPAGLLRERDPARSPQGGAGPHRRSGAGSQGRARDDGGRPRRLAGHSPSGHPTRRQLPSGVPEGAAFCSATLQRRGAPGRLHQGAEDRSNGVLGGIRASLLSAEFE